MYCKIAHLYCDKQPLPVFFQFYSDKKFCSVEFFLDRLDCLNLIERFFSVKQQLYCMANFTHCLIGLMLVFRSTGG